MAERLEEIRERIELFIGRRLNENELKPIKCENTNAYKVYGIVQKNKDESSNFIFCRAEEECSCRLIMIYVPFKVATSIDETYQKGAITYIGSTIKVEW